MAKIQTPQAVRGTQDMFGETEERFAHVVATFERGRRLYGFTSRMASNTPLKLS